VGQERESRLIRKLLVLQHSVVGDFLNYHVLLPFVLLLRLLHRPHPVAKEEGARDR
jgi:hypothetical protein